MSSTALQTLVLIGSDGQRASISRAIATEASYVLRDLLDGQDFINDQFPSEHGDEDHRKASPAPPSLDDLFGFIPTSGSPTAEPAQQAPSHSASPESALHGAQTRDIPARAPKTVELSLPFFTGDILQRVCAHMSYRFRISTFGTEDGCVRVYPVKMKTVPKPMTLPLNEYLDAPDRHFIADWDEKTTVLMVKAATLLNYEELLQLASAKLASYFSEKSVDGIRALLGVEDDFTPAEEAELRKEQPVELQK